MLVLLLLVICQVQAAWAEDVYALLYPQVDGSTRAIFDDVRRTIRQRVSGQGDRLIERVVPQGSDNRSDVRSWLGQAKPNIVLALGRTAFDAVAGLERTYSIVVGLADVPVQERPDVSAVSLLPEPSAILTTIQMLNSKTQRVLVVYDPARHAWLIEIATTQARALGLSLVPLRTSDIRAASMHFTNIFRYSNPSTDALWIIDSQFVTEDATLPLVIEESWLNHFSVCSTAAQHLARGVLCTAYVSPGSVGDWMMRLAEERSAGRMPRIVMPHDAARGVNVRVASHLGLALSPSLRQRFALIVGE